MAAFIRLQTENAERAIRELGSRAPKAIARGLNRTASNVKVAMSRSIATDLRLKVGVVKDNIGIWSATPDRLNTQLTASNRRIPLIEFGARGPFPSRGRGRGVSVRLPGGQSRLPRAFIGKMASGHRGVFKRKPGIKRLPIVELKGPSIARVFEKHAAVGKARHAEQLEKNVAHEIEFALTQIRRKQ